MARRLRMYSLARCRSFSRLSSFHDARTRRVRSRAFSRSLSIFSGSRAALSRRIRARFFSFSASFLASTSSISTVAVSSTAGSGADATVVSYFATGCVRLCSYFPPVVVAKFCSYFTLCGVRLQLRGSVSSQHIYSPVASHVSIENIARSLDSADSDFARRLERRSQSSRQESSVSTPLCHMEEWRKV